MKWRFLAALIWLAGRDLLAESPQPVRFNRDIRPIMSDTCFKCHGPGTRKAGLRLDLPEEAFKPTQSGAVQIVPGKPDDSEAVRRVFATDEGEIMPPPDAHKTLSAAQKDLFKRWVQCMGIDHERFTFKFQGLDQRLTGMEGATPVKGLLS